MLARARGKGGREGGMPLAMCSAKWVTKFGTGGSPERGSDSRVDTKIFPS